MRTLSSLYPLSVAGTWAMNPGAEDEIGQHRAEAIMDALSPEARRAILAVAKKQGLNRKSRRITAALIRKDLSKQSAIARRDYFRGIAKARRDRVNAARVAKRGAPLVGMTQERFASLCEEHVIRVSERIALAATSLES